MRATWMATIAVGLLVGGCGRDGEAPAASTLEQPAYAAPPVVLNVSRAPTGALAISGRAGPDERVRLIGTEGEAHGVTAGADGAFSIPLPAGPAVDRLLAVSVQRAGRGVSADGWLFSPALEPEHAVMLRPGGASLPVGAAPLLAVVDMDGGGGVAVSGVAEPEAPVSILIDGRERGRVRADASGRWFLALPTPVLPGPRRVGAVSGDQRLERTLDLAAGQPAAAFETSRSGDAIRVAWMLPGGGAQTTYILPR